MVVAPPYDPENSRQDALLAQVRALTQEHGARKTLAEILKIQPSLLSAYLADPPTRRPNGEMTLALQEWVNRASNTPVQTKESK